MDKHYKFDKRAYEVFGAIFVAILLNVIITLTLVLNQHITLSSLAMQMLRTLFIYFLLCIASLIILMFDKRKWLKVASIIIIGVMTWHLLYNLVFLLIDPKIQENGLKILTDAALIWFQNVIIFSLWYWFLDRGGPLNRANDDNAKPDFSFPQQQAQYPGWEKWKPRFMDYFYLSYTNSISFAPADTVPLSRTVKYFMMSQAGISLIIIGMVVSRAMNLLD